MTLRHLTAPLPSRTGRALRPIEGGGDGMTARGCRPSASGAEIRGGPAPARPTSRLGGPAAAPRAP